MEEAKWKKILLRIPKEDWRTLKLISATKDINMSKMLRVALKNILEENKDII